MSLTFAAVVMTLSEAPRPSQIRWCLLPAFRLVDWRRTGVGAPFFARMWEPSTQARDQSSSPTAFSSASRTWCSRKKTPAPCHRPRRRQHVLERSVEGVCEDRVAGHKGYCAEVLAFGAGRDLPTKWNLDCCGYVHTRLSRN